MLGSCFEVFWYRRIFAVEIIKVRSNFFPYEATISRSLEEQHETLTINCLFVVKFTSVIRFDGHFWSNVFPELIVI
jgi:hypothetical protein